MTLYGFSPWALALFAALAAAALYVLHRLRVRPERRPVPTLLFWREAVEETRARTLFGRFRHPRTYVFLLALALLGLLALAEPETASERAAARHLVLVVDTDPGTQAPGVALDAAGEPDLTPPAFDRIRGLALDLVDALADRDRVAVLTTVGDRPAVAAFGESRDLTRQRIAALGPAGAAADVKPALARAARLLAGRSHPHVILLTGPATSPGRESGPAAASVLQPGSVPLTVVRTGVRGADLALTAVRFLDPDRLQVRVQGRAESRDPARSLVVRSLREGKPGDRVASGAVGDLGGPGAAVDAWIQLSGVPADGGAVEIVLEPADVNPANDRLVYVRPWRQTRAVRVEPSLPDAVRLLVEAHPRLRLTEKGERSDLTVRAALKTDLAGDTVPAGTRMHAPELSSIQDMAGEPDAADDSTLPGLAAGARPLVISAGSRLEPGAGRTVLQAADRPLVWLQGRGPGFTGARAAGAGPGPVLWITPDLVASESGFLRCAAGAGWLARCLERSAGNRGGSLVRPAGVRAVLALAGPGWLAQEGTSTRLEAGPDRLATLPPLLEPDSRFRLDDREATGGTQVAADTEAQRARNGRLQEAVSITGAWPIPPATADVGQSDEAPDVDSAGLPLREWLLLILLSLGLVEAWLHVKGRIP